MNSSHRCYIPSFVEIGPPVPEKKIFEGFLPYMGVAAMFVMWPRCREHTFVPCITVPPSKEAPHKIWLRLAKQFWRRRCLKLMDGWTDVLRTMDGSRSKGILKAHQWAFGSGELKICLVGCGRLTQVWCT